MLYELDGEKKQRRWANKARGRGAGEEEGTRKARIYVYTPTHGGKAQAE